MRRESGVAERGQGLGRKDFPGNRVNRRKKTIYGAPRRKRLQPAAVYIHGKFLVLQAFSPRCQPAAFVNIPMRRESGVGERFAGILSKEQRGRKSMAYVLEAVRLDLRRNALWRALAALMIFLLASLVCILARPEGREAAWTLESAPAIAGVVALCALFSPEQERGVRESVAARGLPVTAVWAVRALWLLAAVWVGAFACALLLDAAGGAPGEQLCLRCFANAAFLGGFAALCSALSGSAFFAAALSALWLALDWCGVMPSGLTLFGDALGLPGNKLTLCLAGLAMLALALPVRARREI